MIADPACPIENYGCREVIRLSSYEDAKEFAEIHGMDTTWL